MAINDLDEWRVGFADALELHDSINIRELVVAQDGAAWSPGRLAGYLDGHEQMTKNELCTCHSCPIHTDDDHEPKANES